MDQARLRRTNVLEEMKTGKSRKPSNVSSVDCCKQGNGNASDGHAMPESPEWIGNAS